VSYVCGATKYRGQLRANVTVPKTRLFGGSEEAYAVLTESLRRLLDISHRLSDRPGENIQTCGRRTRDAESFFQSCWDEQGCRHRCARGRMRRHTVRSTIATFFLFSLRTSTQVRALLCLTRTP